MFISNGQDNCFGTIFAQNADKLLTYEKLAVELQKRNVRIIPIGFDGATAERIAAPRFLDAGMLMTNFEALDRLAQFGGTGLKNDDAKRNMTMYGEACAHFKKSRATNIVVEYGCMPVPVLL